MNGLFGPAKLLAIRAWSRENTGAGARAAAMNSTMKSASCAARAAIISSVVRILIEAAVSPVRFTLTIPASAPRRYRGPVGWQWLGRVLRQLS